MVMNFSQSPDGMLYLRTGLGPVLRWDGFTDQLETAGIEAPASAVVVSGSGSGDIVGTYYAYVRYLDRLDYTSSLSPLSADPGYVAAGTTSDITAASNASPIVVTTSGAHGLATGQLVFIEDVLGNTATNGNFTATVVTPTKFSLDGSTGNANYISGGTVTTGVGEINYTAVPISTDPKVTRRQILRNKSGTLSVFYVDVDTEDLSSTAFDSTNTDANLGEAVALEDANGNDLAVSRFAVPSTTKSISAHLLGRMFAAVVINYEEGCVSVTNGSTTVTGIGTRWTGSMAARWLDVAGADRAYEINEVTADGTLTLTEPYGGTTDPFASYAIRPGLDERREITWSESGFPEAWPTANSRILQEDPGAGELTGLMLMRSWLYILAEYRVYRLSYNQDPATDGVVVTASMSGCVNNRCWVIIDGLAYMLSYVGIHAFAGNSDDNISADIQDLFEGSPSGKWRINWDAQKFFHAVHDPGEQVIRWFVALSGSYTPHHAICYHYRRKAFWIEEYPYPVGCSALGLSNGRPQAYLGTDAKRFVASGIGTLDGIDKTTGTTRGTVTSSGPNWFVDSTATFPGGAPDYPVQIVAGKGKGQTMIVSSVTSTRCTIAQPWRIQPDTTSTYQIGGISWLYRSPWLQWHPSTVQMERAISVQFKPTTAAATMDLRLYRDLSETADAFSTTAPAAENNGVGTTKGKAELSLTTTKSDGYVQHRMSDYKQLWADGRRYMAYELIGVQNTEPQRVYRVRVDGVQSGS